MFEKLLEKAKNNKSFKIITEFSFLQFFFWSTWAIYGAYLVYYLGDIGYSNMRIGTLMSLRTFMGLIGPPLIGYISDRIESRKIVFMISMTLLGITVAPFPYYSDFWVAVSIAMIGILWEPQQSVLDSWIIETSEETALNYGFMRAWGSIGFAITVTVFGQIIDYFGWKVHFFGYGVIALTAVLIAFNIEDNSYQKSSRRKDAEEDKAREKANNTALNTDEIMENEKSEFAKSNKKETAKQSGEDIRKQSEKEFPLSSQDASKDKNILKLFKNKGYIFILFITVLIFIPAMMVFVYLAPAIKAVGGDSRDLGYTLFFNALSEAPIFFTAKYFLQRFKTKPLLFFAALFYLIRIVIVALAPSPGYFILFGLLQSLSYGVFLVTVRYYVKLVAPDGLKTTAQSIALMAGFGAGGIIGSLLGGYLIDNFGMDIMLLVCSALSLTSVMTIFISIVVDKFKEAY